MLINSDSQANLPFHKESGEVQQPLYELPYYEVIFARVCCSFSCHVTPSHIVYTDVQGSEPETTVSKSRDMFNRELSSSNSYDVDREESVLEMNEDLNFNIKPEQIA